MCFLSEMFVEIEVDSIKQARKLQATLDGCNPKLRPTDRLTDGGEV